MFLVLARFWILLPGIDGLISVDSHFGAFPGVAPPESGLGGRLEVRTPPRGGCGKELILMVFLTLFPAPVAPAVARNFGRLVPDPGVVGGGIPEDEGARNEDFGRRGELSILLRSDVVGTLPVLLRVLAVGNAGNALVGGPYAGPAGRGIAAAMAQEVAPDQISEW